MEVKWDLVIARFIMTRYYTWCDNNQCTRAAFQTLKSQTTRAFYEYFGEKGYEDIRLLCICNHIMTGIELNYDRYWFFVVFESWLKYV